MASPMVSPMISLRGSGVENNALIKPSATPKNALGKALGGTRDNDNLFMLSQNDKLAKEENSLSFQNESVEQMLQQRGKTTNANMRYKSHDQTNDSMDKDGRTELTEIVRSKNKGITRKDTKGPKSDNGLDNMP